jgi:hypothetical protein
MKKHLITAALAGTLASLGLFGGIAGAAVPIVPANERPQPIPPWLVDSVGKAVPIVPALPTPDRFPHPVCVPCVSSRVGKAVPIVPALPIALDSSRLPL